MWRLFIILFVFILVGFWRPSVALFLLVLYILLLHLSKNIKLKDVKRALQVRNKLDKQRKISPLLKHRNSIIVNSQKLNKKEMVKKMSKHIEEVMNN